MQECVYRRYKMCVGGGGRGRALFRRRVTISSGSRVQSSELVASRPKCAAPAHTHRVREVGIAQQSLAQLSFLCSVIYCLFFPLFFFFFFFFFSFLPLSSSATALLFFFFSAKALDGGLIYISSSISSLAL